MTPSPSAPLVVVCPGLHDPALTTAFLDDTGLARSHRLAIFPSDRLPPYSMPHLLQWLAPQISPQAPLCMVAFSAGVVGAIGAAIALAHQGHPIQQFIALDGWGVPLYAPFPISRMSHDGFTHWSSVPLGMGKQNFYADPAVDHLDLWRSPRTVVGYATHGISLKQRITAAQWLGDRLSHAPQNSDQPQPANPRPI